MYLHTHKSSDYKLSSVKYYSIYFSSIRLLIPSSKLTLISQCKSLNFLLLI